MHFNASPLYIQHSLVVTNEGSLAICAVLTVASRASSLLATKNNDFPQSCWCLQWTQPQISLYIEVFIICPWGVIKTLIWVFCLRQPQDGNISTAFVLTLLAYVQTRHLNVHVHVWMYSAPIAPFTVILYFRLPSQHPSPVLIIHCQWMKAWWERESQYLRPPVFAWNHSKHVLLTKSVASLLTRQHVFSLTLQEQQIIKPAESTARLLQTNFCLTSSAWSVFLASDEPDVCNAGEYSRFALHHIYKLPPAVLVTSTIPITWNLRKRHTRERGRE